MVDKTETHVTLLWKLGMKKSVVEKMLERSRSVKYRRPFFPEMFLFPFLLWTYLNIDPGKKYTD